MFCFIYLICMKFCVVLTLVDVFHDQFRCLGIDSFKRLYRVYTRANLMLKSRCSQKNCTKYIHRLESMLASR